MIKLSYEELNESLEELDELPHIDSYLGEAQTGVVMNYLKKNCWEYDDKKEIVTVLPDGAKLAKKMAVEIGKGRKDFWSKKNSDKGLKTLEGWGFKAAPIHGRLYISNDGMDYCSDYVLYVCAAIEHCLNKKKKAA